MAYYDFNKNKGFVTVSNIILRTKKLSLADKGLIALMMSFPKPPDYRITISGLAKYCGESEDTISKRVKELQTAGFVKRTRINDSNGRLCYIYEINQEPVYKVDAATSSFGKPNPEKPEKEQPPPEKSVPVEPTSEKSVPVEPTSEKSAPVEPSPEKPAPVEPSPEKPVLVEPPTEKPYKDNSALIIKEKNNKEFLKKENNNQSINQIKSEVIGLDEIDKIRDRIRENIEYDIICGQEDKAIIDEIVEIMVECLATNNTTVKISGALISTEIVKSRFLQINSEHIEYILFSLKRSTTKKSNIKEYLKTVIYNAPTTINNFFAMEVNHDLNSA